jgi:hypothetical protein
MAINLKRLTPNRLDALARQAEPHESSLRALAMLCLFALLATICAPVFAQSRSNPNATLSIVDGPAVRLAPGATADPLFHVRIVDAHGAPIPGLVVQFVPDGCGVFGGQLDTCAPGELYGQFADQTTAAHVVTDANGVAAAPAFIGGAAAAVYLVAGCVFVNDYPENAVIGSSLCLDLEVDQIALDAAIPITSAFTGAWYDPNQSGHGLFLEVLEGNRLLAYWFTFDQFGQQTWFGGVGDIRNDLAILNVDTGTGGRWIPDFNPSTFRVLPWGTLMLQFSDCNHGRVDFTANASNTGAFGYGHTDLTRITMPAGLGCN